MGMFNFATYYKRTVNYERLGIIFKFIVGKKSILLFLATNYQVFTVVYLFLFYLLQQPEPLVFNCPKSSWIILAMVNKPLFVKERHQVRRWNYFSYNKRDTYNKYVFFFIFLGVNSVRMDARARVYLAV